MGVLHTGKRVCRSTRKYRVANNRVDEPNGKYEPIPLNDFLPEQRLQPNDNNPRLRTRVMVLDEHGNIPQYTLRTRSVDGTADKFTTYYNCRIVKETEI
mgnify:CR=1 FL=1